ncbi:MAG: EAL domain-containing protein [Actinomycetota bacterium]|nr:EAL domain-containing protein [Actinomycetota bacterium]
MRNRAFYLYPIGAAIGAAIYFASGHPSVLFNLIGLSSPLLILVAVHVHKPERRLPWILFAVGQMLFIAGDVIAYNYEKFSHVLPGIFKLTEDGTPFPSWGDPFYLGVYPCLIGGVLLLIRSRTAGRDRASLIDALMLAIGTGALSWVYLISPLANSDSPTIVKLVSMAYPIMDLLLVAALIRLTVGTGRRPPSFYLMVAAIASLFATDAIYGWMGLHTPYQPGSGLLEIGWMAFYVLWGMAALHPSMAAMSEPTPDVETKLTKTRLSILASVSLIAPVIMAIQLIQHKPTDMPILVGATIVLFALVVVRMWGLVRSQQQSATREKALREAGAALVTATSRDGIHAAAIEAARSLAGSTAAIRVCEQPEDTQEFVVVAAAGGRADVASVRFPTTALSGRKRDVLLANDSYLIHTYESTLVGTLSLPSEDEGSVFVAPLFILDELRGLIVVATPQEMAPTVADALRALSSQVALALESAILTEDVLIQQSEKRFSSLVQNSSDIVTVIEADTTVRYASPSAERVIGFEPAELEGTRLSDLIHPDERTKVLSFLTSVGEGEGHTGLLEFRIRHRNGEYIYVETLRTSLLHDPNVRGIVLNTRDISERKAFEEQLEHQAFHDSVTNLANRALFHDRVTHAVERQERDHKPVAVLFMDLDDFKTINDSLGHAAGDQVLAEVGERLKAALRAADTAARLGGDEFAILLEDGGDGVQAADVAERTLEMLDEPFVLEGKEVFVRASIGIAVAEGGETGDAEELLRNADVAMYMAKERGKGRYQVFEPAMHDTALKRLELKADLQRAMDHDEFILHYQPVIELESGKITGVEALIRWIHPERGLVPPLDFIPLAEETGMIVTIGRWVLREACRYAVSLREQFPGIPDFHMAVNLSARQLTRPEIVDEVRDTLAETGLPPEYLILEITESVMMHDMELSIARLTELKGLGVRLAVDDFGTGYSSLNYIRRFPVDILKVDKSFVDGVSEGGEASALTAAVIELAAILNLKPVAEGIERADQLDRLLELHCDFGQGYLFAKPLPGGELQSLLGEKLAMQAEADALTQG